MTAIVDTDGVAVRELPECDTNDPAALEMWHGNFGHFEILRKSVLASCREIERTKALRDGVKLSDERCDNFARSSALYLDFCISHMEPRRLREENVRQSLIAR